MLSREFGIHIHEEWKGMTQPVGLVVEPVVLDRLGIFPENSIKVISDLQTRLETLLEDHVRGDQTISVANNFKTFCKELLDWQDTDLINPEKLSSDLLDEKICFELEDYGDVLKPDWIVPEINKQDNKKNIQILVQELEVALPFDEIIKNSENKKQWEVTPQQRFERLLKETENPVGILWNGISLRLVYAPRGESSGHITFPLEPMISVDGRPMIAALEMLLGPDRLFEGGSQSLRLKTIMELSRKEQNEVSTRLSEQVLEALWILVRGFDEAERKAYFQGETVLGGLLEEDPSHIYGGLITVLLRLVFLLYSEDEELMPIDSLYVENYSVTGLAAKLRRDRNKFQGAMDGRQGAWASLLGLFRLVFDGGGPYETYLPARHGELFDPDTYPFLEGREKNTSFKDSFENVIPFISDDVVDRVLNKLLLLDGQLLSYRSLDVEQIGSVYEAIMGFRVEKANGNCIGIKYRTSRQKINITFVINADIFLSLPSSKRENWLKVESGVELGLPKKIINAIREASNLNELCQAFENRLSPYTLRGLKAGSLVLQPTPERRRSGSHYTPRELTEPIVEETFRPWMENLSFKPSAKDILSLKVCDIAMGSGAFLVATCRFLAKYLILAWQKEGFPSELSSSKDKDIYARRLVAQKCLYGVDKNPFAVSLAKLSLWLITLSKELPFTFVDHALRCGDSLVGFSVNEIESANEKVQLGFIDENNKIFNSLSIRRQEAFSKDNTDDFSYEQKKNILHKQIQESSVLRNAGDLMVAAFFSSKKIKERIDNQNIYLSLLRNSLNDENQIEKVENIIKFLLEGEKGIRPFHWDLEFPEVFNSSRSGFDILIGNPPFAGKNTIAQGYREGIQDWFKKIHNESHGNADLVSHFFRRGFNLLSKNGTLGLISTNTISEGDTRNTGLKWICKNGGTIYAALKNFKWPGIAAVVVSVVYIHKGPYLRRKILDKNYVDLITAFLLPYGGNEDHKELQVNKNKCYQGVTILGMGFTFDDSNKSDEEEIGVPSPISKMNSLILKDKKNEKVIFPYIGGDEVNNSATQKHHRYVINFGEMSESFCRQNWPELMHIVETKVKPQRFEKNNKKNWWQFERKRPELSKALQNFKNVFVTNAQASVHHIVSSMPAKNVFANSLNIFLLEEWHNFAVLQSTVHEIYARFLSSSLGYGLRYNPTDCFSPFVFPLTLIKASENEKLKDLKNILNDIGERYHSFRLKIMSSRNEGLTSIYNKYHDPNEFSEDILELRRLHQEIDNFVLKAYGWSDLAISKGFEIYIQHGQEEQNYSELLKILEKNDNYFSKQYDAKSLNDFINNSPSKPKKFFWRHTWPSKICEEIIARLHILNENVHNEEKAKALMFDKKTSKINSKKALHNRNEEQQINIDFY